MSKTIRRMEWRPKRLAPKHVTHWFPVTNSLRTHHPTRPTVTSELVARSCSHLTRAAGTQQRRNQDSVGRGHSHCPPPTLRSAGFRRRRHYFLAGPPRPRALASRRGLLGPELTGTKSSPLVPPSPPPGSARARPELPAGAAADADGGGGAESSPTRRARSSVERMIVVASVSRSFAFSFPASDQTAHKRPSFFSCRPR